MFTKTSKISLLDKAKNLWLNICTYRPDSAKKISKSYAYDNAIILTHLQNYPNLKSYSGHRRGKAGDSASPSASKTLDQAITYLNNCASNTETPSYR